MVMRKAQTSAIPSKWIKSYKEVLEVPGWNFVERYVKDGVQFCHGEGGTARTKCRADMMNTVQGISTSKVIANTMLGKILEFLECKLAVGLITKPMQWLMQNMVKNLLLVVQ